MAVAAAGLVVACSNSASRPEQSPTSAASTGHGAVAHCLAEHGAPAAPGPAAGPPPGVDQKAANDPNRLTSPECSSCHQQMDLIGLGFENYDAIGRYRSEDASGKAIVAEGEVGGQARTGAWAAASHCRSNLASVPSSRNASTAQDTHRVSGLPLTRTIPNCSISPE